VLTYEPTDSVLLYGSYTRGYKGPAWNVFFNHTAPANAAPIDEEISDSYEVGFKSRFADDRAQLNVSIFDVTYEGFQANNFILINNAAVSNLTNAGTVTSKGFELDFSARASDELTITTSIANADASIEKFNPNPLTNAPSAINGTKLLLAPEWSYNLGADFEKDIGGFRVYANGLLSYTGDQFSELGEVGPIDSNRMLNASIGFSDLDDKFRLTFHGRNLLDENYVLLNTSAGQRYHIPRDADRYWGVSLRARVF
jgi:iron complex outermembrane recepter protein